MTQSIRYASLAYSFMRGVPFDVKVYVKAVEGYLDGKKNVDEILKKTGISRPTFFNKLREYREKEGRIDRPQMQGRTGPKALRRTKEFDRALKELKREHPNYGKRRLTRELAKGGLKVSESTTRRTLAEMGLGLPPKKGGSAMQSSIIRRQQEEEEKEKEGEGRGRKRQKAAADELSECKEIPSGKAGAALILPLWFSAGYHDSWKPVHGNVARRECVLNHLRSEP